MTTLTDTQTAFREAPSFATAVAYMDAAIEEWWEQLSTFMTIDADQQLKERMEEIRNWLAIPRVSDMEMMVRCKGV